MNKKIRRKRSAFSLVEMSVVILIISIIASGALTVAKTSMKNANTKITRDRMDAIYKAMTNYLAINKKLPCPASLELDNTNSNFGTKVGSDGTCSGTGVVISSNLIWGMVPTAELGLARDAASDGFGTKFDYVVDKRFTRITASIAEAENVPPIGFEGNAGNQATNTILPVIMNIMEGSASGTNLTPWAIMVIISHGPDKLGGYNATGTSTQNTSTGAAADELENIRSASFNSLFVNNSNDQNYDDIIIYKRKLDLINDAGLEFILCPTSESAYYITPSKTLVWVSAYYDGTTTLQSTVKCNTPVSQKINRMCGKYGLWTFPNPTCTS
jgi:prepilin-type N-terminal cleavage/methylation domain-containing protein